MPSEESTYTSISTVQDIIRSRELLRSINAPIHIFWTSDVPSHEADMAIEGVQQAVDALGGKRQVKIIGSKLITSEPFGSPDWYRDAALHNQDFQNNGHYGPQIDVGEIMNLFAIDPWQRNPSVGPHINVFIVNHDLTDYTDRQTPLWRLVPPNHPLRTQAGPHNRLNFVYGSSYQDFASIQSVRRLLTEEPVGVIRDEMLRRLFRHELGHVFGVPISTRTAHVESRLGLHCTNMCSMRQGESFQDWKQDTIQEMENGITYCSDCLHDFAIRKTSYK